MKFLSAFFLLFSCALAQESIRGKVLSPSGEPVFAANVSSRTHPQMGTITDLDGKFEWQGSLEDTLVVSYPGYTIAQVALAKHNPAEQLLVELKEKSLSLQEVSIRAQRPISEEFSVVRLEKLDIYLNPLSAADPLRAIAILPASTNARESANPALRGSAANRSRVVVNGVPIYQPVRNSQINGLGNFSLFNTELVESQFVYASNPPLTYGNSSGGLVQIETNRSLSQNSTQFSAGLANLGIFRNQKLGDEAFAQVYGNYQFSGAFTGIQPRTLDFLKSFSTQDMGLHLCLPLGKKWNIHSFSYGIRESYQTDIQTFAHRDLAIGTKDRTFHILRLSRQGKKGLWNTHAALDLSRSDYRFGNLRSHTQSRQTYFSTEYKRFAGENFSWQVGANYDGFRRAFDDSASIFHFSNRPDLPTRTIDTLLKRTLLEGHAYASWTPTNKFKVSAGLRSNLPLEKQVSFLSFQSSIRWNPSTRHSILLSGGRYHSYAVPIFFQRSNELLRCEQLALDYSYKNENAALTLAIFGKDEVGTQVEDFLRIERSRIFGVEASAETAFSKYFRASIANTFLLHKIRFLQEAESFRGSRDLPYFVKASLSFNHPALFSFSAVYVGRPGTPFNPISSATYLQEYDLYQPQWPGEVYGERLPGYHNLSLSLSRYQLIRQGSLVLFFSINNVLNRVNPRDIWYNEDFSKGSYAPFSLRTIYFGVVWAINDRDK